MKSILPLAALIAAFSAGTTYADDGAQTYPWSVGLGAAFIHSSAVMEDVRGPFTPPGLQLKIANTYTPYLSIARNLDDHFDIQAALGAPPKEEVKGKGPATVGSVPYDGVTLARAYVATPTVFVNYHFFAPSMPVRPFIGVGLNYTKFFDVKSTPDGDNANGGPTKVVVDDSIGIAGQVGANWHIQNHWSVKGSVAWAQVKSKLTATTSGVERSTRVNFNPTVVLLTAEYAF